MVISIFKPPEDGKTWAEQKTGDICDCISLEYEKFFNGVGTFTAELPVNTRFRDKLLVGSVLMTDSGDALIVKNIKTTLDKITLTGYDLNGLLCDRLTLSDAEDGYDLQKGVSETIIKHFVSANLADCELDPNRNLPRFGVAEDKLRGLTEDKAMPRLQNLHDLVTEICGAAKLGWRISVSGNAANDKPIFVFDVAERVDRSVNQSEKNRVIFSAQTHNISTMTREVGVTAAKNALFLDIGGTVVQYPQSGDDSGRAVFVGYDRREEYCSLATDSMDRQDYVPEAEQNMADRMNETDSLTIEAGNPLDYGVLYDVGTIVTVYDRERSLQLDSVISAVTVRRSGTEYSVKLTLGESKPKLLDQYQKKGEVTQKTVRNEGGKSSSPTGALTEYQYLTDTSVKFNGVTYTAEKDADTGLISKISDSNGNSLEPEISAGITDVALHNAVFWAVAMARGFGKPDVLPASDGITDYFDCNLGVSGGKWKNQISGGSDISLVGAELQADGSVGVYGTSSSYGLLTSPAPENGARSLYLVFKTAAVGVIKCNIHTIGAAVSPVRTGSWFGLGADGYAGGSTIQSDQFIIAIDSSIASTSYHVAVLTRSADGLNTLYIDGTAIGTMSNSVKYGDVLGIGLIALDGNPQGSTSVLQQIKGIVVASVCHDSNQVAQNTAWLKKHYGI